MCVDLLSVKKEKRYVLQDKMVFSIKQKVFDWREGLPLQEKENCLNGKGSLLKEFLETWKASLRREKTSSGSNF